MDIEDELEAKFVAAERSFLELEDKEFSQHEDIYQEKARRTIQDFMKTGELIRQAAVFSPNELRSDIDAKELRYILAAAYLGDLVLKLNDQSHRTNHLEASEEYIKVFLAQCRRLGLLEREDEAILLDQETTDPHQRREEKINRFKREKQAKDALKALTTRIQHDVRGDESPEREHVLALFSVWVHRSCSNLSFVRQELSMLRQIEEMRELHGGELPAPPPPRSTGFKPFTLTRDMVKVFGSGYPSMPTLTVEQAASIEHDMGLHQCAGSHDTKRPDPKLMLEEDNAAGYAAQDVQTMKDRGWSQYKDENPYGAGNRYNKS